MARFRFAHTALPMLHGSAYRCVLALEPLEDLFSRRAWPAVEPLADRGSKIGNPRTLVRLQQAKGIANHRVRVGVVAGLDLRFDESLEVFSDVVRVGHDVSLRASHDSASLPPRPEITQEQLSIDCTAPDLGSYSPYGEELGACSIATIRATTTLVGPDVDIIANDYHGTYSLTAGVKIGSCDIQKLRAIGDATISELADRLAKQLEAPPKV
jgi:hypothetical protein